MRFIVGLLAGAFTILIVAAALDVPADDRFQQAREHWHQISNSFAGQHEERGSGFSTLPAQLPGTPAQPLSDDAPVPAPEPDLSDNAPTWSSDGEQQEPADVHAVPRPEEQTPEPSSPIHAGEATVWSPFHSEASATGFANRLTRQLKHPFLVRKLGPAEYVVVYAYADANEHHTLQQRIAAVTGASST